MEPAAVHEEDGAGGEVVSVVDDLVDVEGDLGVVRGGVELGDAVHLGDVVLDGSGRGVGADLEGAEVVDEHVGVGRAGSGVISGTSGEGGGARIGVGAGATTDGVGVGGISDAVGRARVDPGGATAEAVAGGGDDLEVVGRGGGLGKCARNSGGSAHAGRGDGGGNSAGVGEHGDDGGAKEGLGEGKAEALGGVGEGGGIGRAIKGLTVVSEVTSTTENAGVVLDHELLAADLDEGVGGNGAAEVLVGVEVLGAVDEGVDAAEVLGVTGVELALAHVGNPVVGDAGVGDLGSVELDGLEDAGVGGEGDGEFGTVVVESADADALGVGESEEPAPVTSVWPLEMTPLGRASRASLTFSAVRPPLLLASVILRPSRGLVTYFSPKTS